MPIAGDWQTAAIDKVDCRSAFTFCNPDWQAEATECDNPVGWKRLFLCGKFAGNLAVALFNDHVDLSCYRSQNMGVFL
ncbi:hypothetical protein FQZ97_1082570 [compost metagenome]